MKKCNFLNPDKYEFLIWFFLGVALSTIFWLITVVIPQFKGYEEIIKDGISPAITIIVALISVIMILCQMKQTEEVQKQTNTLQLIDSLLYQHFKIIFKKIKEIESTTINKVKELQQEIPFNTQFDDIETPDTEPNENHFEYEGKRLEIDNEAQQKINTAIEEFLDFIFDIEVKIEHNLINEELAKLYFKEPIFEILTRKFISNMLQFSGYKINNDYSKEKKEKIITLSKRWFQYNYLEMEQN